MSERIVIDFDDEEEKPKKEKETIVIDLSEEINKIEIDNIEDTYEEKILKKNIDCSFRGNSGLNNFFESSLNFPEGIEKGFRQSFRISLRDDFFNSVLFNNRYVILSSCSGYVYFIDRFTGYVEHKIQIKDQIFEKTGLVISNTVYLSSLKKIFRYGKTGEKSFEPEELYTAPEGFLIWSSLNRQGNKILFTEQDTLGGTANLVLMDITNPDEVFRFELKVKKALADRICIAGRFAFVLIDSSLLVFDTENLTGEIKEINVSADENSFLFYSSNRLYITTVNYELYYLDLPYRNTNFKNTGIKNNYINSAGSFGDNLFTGTMEGWNLFKSTGLKIYEYEDEYENRIESISRNVIVISKSNKIVFSNLNRFQEAEGYVISSDKLNESEFIISAVISENEIFILTRKGILESFTNDKLNIHI
ncbi:MAG: hypothetical protein JSS91_06790 [Bacteroidetes bacterium]|nr:hypothetical protein [Bacteroidota bacterium]